jgi:hypothetical protein
MSYSLQQNKYNLYKKGTYSTTGHHVGVTYLSRTKSELAGSHRLMSRPDTCLGIRTHISIYGGMEHLIFRLMYV